MPTSHGPASTSREHRFLVPYDADCGICKWLLAGLLRWDRRRRLRPVPLQGAEAGALLGDLDEQMRMASWHLVSPGGERLSGGAALPRLLRLLPGGRLPAAILARFPRLTDGGYRWVAGHRSQLSRFVRASVKRRAGELVRSRSRGAARREFSLESRRRSLH